jgi:diguanylate cyclase (GGDEF)-like protein/PAS domain S-box-containing protein
MSLPARAGPSFSSVPSRIGALAARAVSSLPHGKTLPPDVWRTRHRFMLGVIWLHVAGLTIAGVVLRQGVETLTFEIAPIAVCGLAAALPTGGRRLRGSMVAFAALYSSAALVNMSHGATEAHFHFFVMVAMLAAYEEWVPYLLAIGFVLVHHGVAGVLDPSSVYDKSSAISSPWKWALIHTGFIVGLSVVSVISWRLNERARADAAEAHESTRRSEAEFRDAFEDAPIGMAIVDLDGGFTRVNRSLAQLTGFTPEQLLTTQLADVAAVDGTAWLDDLHAGISFECELTRADGSAGWGLVQRSALQGATGDRSHVLLQILDVTERKAAAQQLAHAAEHDVLTGLPNRAYFERSVDEAIASLGPEHSLAILFVDLDNFKLVNDSLGHGAGDRLLVLVAQRLRAALDPADVVARFGGDEFVVLLPESTAGDALATARRLRAELSRPCDLDGQRRFVTASVGVTLSNSPDATAVGLIRDGDAAMYRAKATGKNSDVLFDEQLRGAALWRLELETGLHGALALGELELHYQLAVDLETDAVFGVEALLRWRRGDGTMVVPDDFLPIAERSGLILPIGRWVVDEACRQAAAWRAEGILDEDALMCVNLSQVQLTRGDTAADVGAALARYTLPAHALCLEVTESAVMLDPDRANRTLAALKRIGVKLAIDDFGTGYSSLAHVRHLMPVDIVKIDRSFVAGLGSGVEDAAVITAIVELADKLGLITIAEGIEHASQADSLRELHCVIGQGFSIGRPAPAADIAERFARAQALRAAA